jgi:hypothetical protein
MGCRTVTASDGFDGPPDARLRPSIIHNARQLDDVVVEACSALVAANQPPVLFVRGGQLVRLRSDEIGRPLIEAMRLDHVRLTLAESATWWRALKDGSHLAIFPPLEVCSGVLATTTWNLPTLIGVVELPVLRPDGMFHLAHGYDPATRLYHWHTPGVTYPTIPQSPSLIELAAAVEAVDEMLCDFPWETTADRANMWGLLLTPLVRAIVNQVPMCLIDAPDAGTGKGLLVSVATILATGRISGLMSWPATDEELEKKVTAALMAGQTTVVFDNVEHMIRSSTLAAVLTADTWQGRMLGRSEMVNVNNRATWMATGNNIDVGGDLARRCYRVRIDAKQARPYERNGWRHDPLEGWVADQRGRLLGALCTIVRSWWVAGRPLAADIAAMGGYTTWVRIVGGILDHAGIGGFLGNLAEFHAAADHESRQWQGFLEVWHDQYGEDPMTVAQLIGAMGSGSSAGAMLKDTIPEDLSGYWEHPGFSRRLGIALRKRIGRYYGDGGLHLVELPKDRRNVSVYSLTKRSDAVPADPQADSTGNDGNGDAVPAHPETESTELGDFPVF